MLTKNSESNQLSLRDQSLVIALGVVFDRVSGLPQDDKDDLFEVARAYAVAGEGTEEQQSAHRAMLEILDQSQGTLRTLQSIDPTAPDVGPTAWCDQVRSRIHGLRKQRGWSQVELANQAGLTQSHVSRLESGMHSPSSLTVEKIAKAFGVPPSELDPAAAENCV